MDFSVKRADQFFCWEHETKAKMYRNLERDARQTGWIRITGLGVALVSAFISLVARVCGVVEIIFKSVINMIGAPFSDDCYFLRGLKQLFVGVAANAILIVITPAQIVIGAVVTIPGLLIDPVCYSNWRYEDHLDYRDRLLTTLS